MLRRLPHIGSVPGVPTRLKKPISSMANCRADAIPISLACRFAAVLLIAAIVIGTAMMVSNFRDHALRKQQARAGKIPFCCLAHHFDQQLDDAAAAPLNDIIVQMHQAGIISARRFQAPDVRSRNAPDVGGQGQQFFQNRRFQYLRRRRNPDQFIGSAGGSSCYHCRSRVLQKSQIKPGDGVAPDRTGAQSFYRMAARNHADRSRVAVGQHGEFLPASFHAPLHLPGIQKSSFTSVTRWEQMRRFRHASS